MPKRKAIERIRLWPFLVVLAISLLWGLMFSVKLGMIPNLVFVGTITADLIAMLFTLSVMGTLFVLLGLQIRNWEQNLLKRSRQIEKDNQSVAHRAFLRRLDHEMRNPLTTMRIGLSNMEQDGLQDHRDSLLRIAQQVQRLQKLTEELRYLTEIEEFQVERIQVDLRDLLQSTIEHTCQIPIYQARTVDLQIQQVPWILPPILGDSDLLFILFRNLIENALKYSRPTDQVVIRASEDGKMVLVEVADTGMGIQPEDLEHVFEDLYRGQNAHGLPGTGLGLAMVQRIIHLHNGKIEINSRLLQGTVLRVWLPTLSKSNEK